MISLIPIPRLLRWVAVSYAATIALAFSLLGGFTDNTVFGWAVAGGTVLHSLLLLIFYIGWRGIWWCIPELNRWLFPDLTGTWSVQITYFFDGKSDEVSAKARITQTFLGLAIHLDSAASESDTLAVIPKRDPQGRPYLYYLYRNTPKNVDGEQRVAYEGAATLKLDHDCDHILGGTYFTEVNSRGRFIFTGPKRSSRSLMAARVVSVVVCFVILMGIALALRALPAEESCISGRNAWTCSLNPEVGSDHPGAVLQ